MIRADPEVIFKLGSEIERWPLFLPHYRYVRLKSISDDKLHRVAAMGARRDFIPVAWRTTLDLFPDERPRRLHFEHIGGITKGMLVDWTLNERPDGSVLVRISHEFDPGWPLIGGKPTELIVGQFFVGTVAGRTLRCVKATAEAAMVVARRS